VGFKLKRDYCLKGSETGRGPIWGLSRGGPSTKEDRMKKTSGVRCPYWKSLVSKSLYDNLDGEGSERNEARTNKFRETKEDALEGRRRDFWRLEELINEGKHTRKSFQGRNQKTVSTGGRSM